MAAVNDRAGAEEQQRLEKRVREQMQHPDRHAADTKRPIIKPSCETVE